MSKILNEMLVGKLAMQVIAGGTMPIVKWSVTVLLDNQKKAAGMILLLKK